jgi:hypothetical protein
MFFYHISLHAWQTFHEVLGNKTKLTPYPYGVL